MRLIDLGNEIVVELPSGELTTIRWPRNGG